MATTQTFIDYVRERLAGTGNVSAKRMFGDALVYIDGKPMFLLCDDAVFVKKIPCIENLMTAAGAASGTPYPGAKPHWILDADDAETLRGTADALKSHVPAPAKKKNKKI